MAHKTKANNFELNSVEVGQVVSVTAGVEPEAFVYNFTIVETGDMPLCDVVQTSPDGTITGPIQGVLEGSGGWTTDRQTQYNVATFLLAKATRILPCLLVMEF